MGFIVFAQGIKIEEKRIKAVRNWLEPQSVRDIQVFLSFANFYRRFIRNFSRITASLTSMLQKTNNEALSIQATKEERNEAISAGLGSSSVGDKVGENIKNLSTIINLVKSKLTKPKKAGLPNTKVNSKTDFLTPRAKKVFIHLQKAFTKAPILRHFDPKRHIWIETDALGYTISKVLSQMTLDYLDHLDQPFSHHVTYKNLDLIFSKSKISQ